ncbi:replication-relaxation family protein [Mycolicibacterium sphagni]|uniref:Replication-relaxation n=1 Tax=Mycolicibacterium sphagni TaxID=1786 RepID=A0A255DE32_9MYCO|nr:replication-relaxation family protein [Mycolicibacterium sphagni]OYN77678.1 hypothetical protein CG716_17445 [Mycolicibacterium sphagni]
MSDYPLGHPLGSTPAHPSPLADERNRLPGLGNSGALEGTTTPAKRPSHRRLSATGITAIADQLSDRDLAIIRSIDDHRFLTVRQIRTIHFADLAPTSGQRTTKRVLARLRGLGVISALTQRIGGVRAGSDGLVHYVDSVGDRILRQRSGRGARRRYEPSARFVHHRLVVAAAHIALITANRHGGLDVVATAVEPATWRPYIGVGGTRRTLKPDLFAETATADELVYAWFVEIDLGTEHIPTLLSKCREYEAYRRAGIEQERHGSFPLVVWSMTHQDPATAKRRRQALAAAIAADRSLPSALFRIVAPDDVVPLMQTGGAE